MNSINPEVKRWFVEKVAQNPEYLEQFFLPAVEKLMHKGEYALHQAIREESIERIKYRMGWFDGVRELSALLAGLRISEGKRPIEPGLLARMFSRGADVPSETGNSP